MYFIGNILGDLKEQPEQDDPTFCFTEAEARELTGNLPGIDIRLEHHPDMVVGNIDKAWQHGDGSVNILAHLNANSIQSHFASRSIKPDEKGFAYYQGLSLGHEHLSFRDGTSQKNPLEVSLCVSPRRSDCRIKRVYSSVDASANSPYIRKHTANKMAEKTDTESHTKTLEDTLVKQEMQIKAQEERLKKFEEMQKEFEEEKAAYEEKERKRLEEEQKREEEERQKQIAKAEKLFQAVSDNWGKQLTEEDYTPEARQHIQNFIQKHPADSMEVLRLAHCASKMFQSKQKAFEEALQNRQIEQTKSDITETVTKKRKHAASTKPPAPVPSVMDVLKKYRTSCGSGRDLMLEKLEYEKQRMPYY